MKEYEDIFGIAMTKPMSLSATSIVNRVLGQLFRLDNTLVNILCGF
jgi:hypothetical protein